MSFDAAIAFLEILSRSLGVVLSCSRYLRLSLGAELSATGAASRLHRDPKIRQTHLSEMMRANCDRKAEWSY